MRKFLFCLTFALCLLATAARVSASNIIASGECGVDGGNVTWTLDDAGTLTIRGSGRMNDYNMNLRSPWYQNRTQIQKVVIEEGVTNVGKRAFAECDVTSVTIPDSVTSIGPYSFSNCTDLEEIAFPSGVTFIDDGAFFNCKSLTRVVIPGNVKMIGDTNLPAWSTLATGAFKGCSALKSVVILDGVTKIGNFSFQLCAAL
ncbi:MAG: leucine-rich repeat domain-containing protein, partial [Oscillospiraceae bacterium]|nr:leucine-rich repeat domain-containing protein [Oscillospiraceae bacterium]